LELEKPDPDAKSENPPLLDYAEPSRNRSIEEVLYEFVARETEENLKNPPKPPHWWDVVPRIILGIVLFGACVAFAMLMDRFFKK
jgi:hypothetical protein